jgi:eukaryotic-like serine/threonine-protein kinase
MPLFLARRDLSHIPGQGAACSLESALSSGHVMVWSLPVIESLFHQALDLPARERGDFLDRSCGGDARLRDEVQLLLDQASEGDPSLREAVASELRVLTSRALKGLVGQKVGSFVLTKLLGEGGMGAVYLGERDQAEFSHRVAVKVLSHSLASSQAIARFRDERRILAALEHPHIVRLLDGGSTPDGLPYLVMEYLEGAAITHYAHSRGLSVRDRVTMIRKVCAALQYAHQNLVVHRDVKPSNILVDAAGEPKVLDFGIAKLLSPMPGGDREARTRTGLGLFTPEYASPEQVRGEAVSTATDVYALGAVLYELVAGRPPHRCPENRLELMKRICEEDPPAPSAVAAPERGRAVATDLDNIILKALHKDVAHRYASMAHLSEDLGRFLIGAPVSARTATFAPIAPTSSSSATRRRVLPPCS